MKKHKHLGLAGIVLLAAAMLLLGGCNTWHGAGQDVQRAGEKMQGH